jgi:formylglycine-generating enzyme required for sulfatase activity
MLIGIGLIFYGVTAGHAAVVSFGTGPNQFSMEFVTIGNPGNTADTTGAPNPAGAVAYTYGMGKFEVSEDMINKFNASQSLQITKDTRGPNKPATSVSWNEAARFVNWLNTSTGHAAAYKFTSAGVNDNIALWTASDSEDYDPLNPYRSKRATFVLPSKDEWYKAAYFDPFANSGLGVYWNYSTGSDNAPTAVASGTGANTAVYGGQSSGPADINQAGGLSPYGVMGLGGNVWEWEETSYDLSNSTPAAGRTVRGGSWYLSAFDMSSLSRFNNSSGPSNDGPGTGLRVVLLNSPGAEVPEPTSALILSFFMGSGLIPRYRNKPRD